ncbi:CHAT domain-containing protein [Oscillatoria salina]|uniref:CHAT domain-containing protein n=1 Tax=Oscillatoria salina TaxID=331517 RepID=UPI001CCD1436|nr:CHAT domain-containing protein [Oscillatoria salina]MBZ8180848.1 CHAT domain-containing protein [Oscillatoria salina IIICB1]
MARKRHLFFRRILSFLRLIKSQLASWLSKKVAYLSLLLSLFVLAAFLPVIAQETVSQNSSSTTILIKQAEINYNLGEYQRAAELLQQATNELENNRQLQAIALTNLSLVYQQQGEWQLAQAAINESLTILQQDTKNNLALLARAWEVQGKLQLAIGKASEAITSWQKAIDNYENIEDKEGKIRTKIHQTVALQELGLYREAFKQLTTIKPEEIEANLVRGAWLRNLGNIVRVVGNVNEIESILPTNICQLKEEESTDYLKISECLLRNSLATIEISNSPQLKAEVSLDLGNTYTAMYQRAKDAFQRAVTQSNNPNKQWELIKQAIEYYEKAENTTNLLLTLLQAQINQLSLLIDFQPQLAKIKDELVRQEATTSIHRQIEQIPDIFAEINNLSISKSAIFTRINLAKSLINLENYSQPELIEQLLLQAIEEARTLADVRTTAYALGTLGKLYEEQKQWEQALEKTQDAIRLTEEIQAPELAYQWEWQLGRLLRNQGEIESAVAAYEVAVKNLELSRQNFLILQSEERFTLQNSLNTFYRELIALLLPKDDLNPDQENLQKSIYYIESLQLAELENFLKCNLTDIETVQLERKDREDEPVAQLMERTKLFLNKAPKTAIVYSVILPDHLVTILQLPNDNKLVYSSSNKDSSAVQKLISEIDNVLKNTLAINEIKRKVKELYDISLQGVEQELKRAGIETLVFILDSSLSRIPMASLYDGHQYLVENYASVLTSSIQFLKHKQFTNNQLKALIVGAIKQRQNYDSLEEEVPQQINKIKENLSNYDILDNGKFTKKALREKFRSSVYDLVHIITHGQFSSDPKETYIITDDDSQEFNEYSININEFSNLLQTRDQSKLINLLFFSACETASGDKRAVLGIAGTAIRFGANATIATLWNVKQEETTDFVDEFYSNLVKKELNIAQALRQTQITMIESDNFEIRHPRNWASFIMVGY